MPKQEGCSLMDFGCSEQLLSGIRHTEPWWFKVKTKNISVLGWSFPKGVGKKKVNESITQTIEYTNAAMHLELEDCFLDGKPL